MADNHKSAAGHEEHDVNVHAITKFGIGLTLTVIATLFLLWGLFNFFSRRLTKQFQPAPETRTAAVVKLPPQPRLQDNPRTDLRAIRSDEDRLLHHYGWVDKEHGVVRIPVERAIDILAQRGLPARPQTGGVQ
jgi:hypothetical protein